MAFAIDTTHPIAWTGSEDAEGHRTYTVKYRLKGDITDGPANALQTSGLHLPGAPWHILDDVDADAYCTREKTVTAVEQEGDPSKYLYIEQKFSTKALKQCQDTEITNPILRPSVKSGSTSQHKEEATKDRFGKDLVNSAFEVLRGPQIEFDKSRHKIKIAQNVLDLELYLCDGMVDTVNAFTLWGLPTRCVKLTSFSWEEKYYGSCIKYYTRTFDFDTNVETFDRDVLDEGTKALNGRWTKDGVWQLININGLPPNPLNPAHFNRFTDRNGNPTKVILDGGGLPFNPAPPATTTACITCPNGAPVKWRVTGFDVNVPSREETITHTSDCNWAGTGSVTGTGTGTSAEGSLTLTFDNAVDKWVLQDLGNLTEWHTDGADWKCMGPNDMTLAFGNGSTSVHLEVITSEPGKIHIEKYFESDFLLLNIPTVL